MLLFTYLYLLIYIPHIYNIICIYMYNIISNYSQKLLSASREDNAVLVAELRELEDKVTHRSSTI